MRARRRQGDSRSISILCGYVSSERAIERQGRVVKVGEGFGWSVACFRFEFLSKEITADEKTQDREKGRKNTPQRHGSQRRFYYPRATFLHFLHYSIQSMSYLSKPYPISSFGQLFPKKTFLFLRKIHNRITVTMFTGYRTAVSMIKTVITGTERGSR